MCGICGATWSDSALPPDPFVLRRMTGFLHHRGPDDEGYYHGDNAMLGMRRLSIIDLQSGQQPLTNEEHTLWLVFNGEIYNYRELRRQLQQAGHVFRSFGDAEVVLHAFEQFGIDCLEHLNGMFAWALWDVNNRRLTLARDRLGIKPLYYWSDGRRLAFSSELKSLMAWDAIPRQIDLAALDQFLTLEYVAAPHTIFADVCKLPAGHWLAYEDGAVRLQRYWEAQPHSMPQSDARCVEGLRDLLASSINLQMVSDVPIGAFLSGGIDSSTVVAHMHQATPDPVRTFSIGFDDATYNELPFARLVAKRFDTEHHEELLQDELWQMALSLVRHMGEPFADFSLFSTYLVSQLARRSVKVALSGDGGDELFGGYDTYRAQQLDRYYGRLPATVRQRILPGLVAQMRPRPAKKGLINKTKRFIEGGAHPAHLQHTRWMLFLDRQDKAALYQDEMQRALGGYSATMVLEQHFRRAAHLEPLAQQQYVDINTYLVDDILTKVDRMSMAASLEVRVPLLDHRIVEFALGLPAHLKLDGRTTKVILRRAMHKILPEAILDKPKEGFSVPLKHWLRGPLNPLMQDLLSPESVQRRGYFRYETINTWMREHLTGRCNHSHRLWALMVLELWHRESIDKRADEAAIRDN